jgi:hypothetical protein
VPLSLRQICLVASDLAAAEQQLTSVLGVAVCYRDPGVEHFGLHNFLLPIGQQFLEVVAPFRDGAAAGRYLDRRGGAGGYMVIMQCDDVQAQRRRMQQLGIRLVSDSADHDGDSAGIQLHPKDVPGAIVELRWNADAAEPLPPWGPAGPNWQQFRKTDVVEAITAAVLQADDPAALADRWSTVLDRPLTRTPNGAPQIALDDATLRFAQAKDGRGEGLGGIDLRVVDRKRLLRSAEALNARLADDLILLAGIRIRLV